MEPATPAERAARGGCELPERVKKMIEVLLENASDISRHDRGQLVFHWAGSSLEVDVIRRIKR